MKKMLTMMLLFVVILSCIPLYSASAKDDQYDVIKKEEKSVSVSLRIMLRMSLSRRSTERADMWVSILNLPKRSLKIWVSI